MSGVPSQDPSVVRLVTIFLGTITLTCIAGLIWLVHDKTDPAALAFIALPAGTALGALGSLLVSTHTAGDTKDDPAPAAGPPGPQGPPGAQGVAGPKGSPGPQPPWQQPIVNPTPNISGGSGATVTVASREPITTEAT